MVVLFFGDVFGRPGREAIKKALPELREKYEPDFIVANIENIAHGAGVTRGKVGEMLDAGFDGFTLGDHAFGAQGSEELLSDDSIPIVRPENYPGKTAGRGWRILERGKQRLLVMNVLGRYGMKMEGGDFFASVKRMLEEANGKYDVSLLDIHAAATSEKRAIAEAFDGQIDAIVGTHTHVQTNDAQTLKKGTGFITDVGMCGPQDSVLGVKLEYILAMLRGGERKGRRELGEGPCEVGAVVVVVKNGRTKMEAIRMTGVTI
jgi:metallophosphoesterase (TIGR00282 family)